MTQRRVHNIAAEIVLGKSKYDSSTEALRELHWLPVVKWIELSV